MPSGKDSRVGLPYRSYEPLSINETELRRSRPMSPVWDAQAETKLWPG